MWNKKGFWMKFSVLCPDSQPAADHLIPYSVIITSNSQSFISHEPEREKSLIWP